MKKTVFILLLLSISVNCLRADFTCDSVIFAIRPENREYLRYLHFENRFDSASVFYRMGEIRVGDTTSFTKVNFIRSKIDSVFVQGESATGKDTILQSYCKTESFTYGTGSSIKFFRMMTAGIPCWASTGGGSPSGGKGDWRDQNWHAGVGRILDDTEWLIQLIRVSDDNILYTIDSVGVNRNPSSSLAQRYGTYPDQMNHQKDLPDNYANTDVYLMVSPKRIGPTPYGMILRIIPNWFSLSSAKEYDSTSNYKLDSADAFIFDSCYYAEFFDYADSIKSATGFLPDYNGLPVLDKHKDSIFLEQYYEPFYSEGDTTWFEIIDTAYLKTSYNPIFEKRKSITDMARITSIFPQPLNKRNAGINIESTKEINKARISIYTANGFKTGILWQGKLKKGQMSIDLFIKDYSSGVYYLVLENSGNNILSYKQFVIAE